MPISEGITNYIYICNAGYDGYNFFSRGKLSCILKKKRYFTGGGQKLRTDSLVLPVADNMFK